MSFFTCFYCCHDNRVILLYQLAIHANLLRVPPALSEYIVIIFKYENATLSKSVILKQGSEG